MKIIFVEVYDFDFFFIMLEVKAYYKFIFSNMSRLFIYRDDYKLFIILSEIYP